MKRRIIVVGILTLICLSHPFNGVTGKEPLPLPQGSSGDAYYQQGNNLLKAQRCSEAVEAFMRAIDLRPFTGAYNDLGRAYMCLTKFPEAEAAFKQALRLNSNNTLALYNLGVAYCHQIKIEDARNVMLELQYRNSQLASELQTEINEALAAQKQLDEAESAIEGAKKALAELKRKNHIADGDRLREIGQYLQAIESYRKAISISPSSESYNGLGLAYLELEQYPNAASNFRQAIKLQPSDPVHHYNLAVAFFDMEEYEKSKTSAKEALRLKPDYAEATNLLGAGYFRLKQYPEALAEFQKAIRLAPNDPQINHNLGKTYFVMGRKLDAERIYRKLLTLDKESAQRLYQVMHPSAKKSN
jgi:Flp pilus assembly protein TadD